MLKPTSPILTTAAHLADEQLVLALGALHDAHSLGAGPVTDARRHIRNVKCLMRLIEPWLEEGEGAEARHRLRTLNRRLAPIAESAAGVRTLAHLSARDGAGAAGPAIAVLREAVVQRTGRNTCVAAFTRLLRQCETALAVERARIGTWEMQAHRREAMRTSIERGIGRDAKAIAAALEQPAAREHAWRRSATDLWLRVRLLEGGRRDLHALRPMLEAMAASLDESRTVTSLEKILATEGLAPRGDTAIVLTRLRRYQREVRARAVARGKAVITSLTGPRRLTAVHGTRRVA